MFLILVGLRAMATTYNVTDNASWLTATTSAADGDTVLFGTGSYTLDPVLIDRNVSFNIVGAGTNLTKITPSSNPGYFVWYESDSSKVVAIHDFTYVDIAGGASGGSFICGIWNHSNTGSYHFYNFQCTNVLGRVISMGYGGSYGLIDHCIFSNAPSGGSPQPIDFQGKSKELGDVTANWSGALPFGTTNATYVEGCYFNANGNTGNGFFDSYNGAQLVFRYNFLVGYAPSGGHGYDSGYSSVRSWEVYNNIWTNTTSGLLLQWRGGSGVVMSNTVYGSATLTRIDYYRSSPTNHNYSPYLGTGKPGFAWDINFNSTTNYPYGTGVSLTGNPVNNQSLSIGFSTYFFTTAYVNNGNYQGLGGGTVVIGANVALTISNLFNCINLGPGAGVTYAAATVVGHDYLAGSYTATDIYLTNALDSNTNIFGYPAYQQSGEINAFNLSGTNINQQLATKWPCYSWSNLVNGVIQDFTVGDNDAQSSYYITNLVKLNRDYFTSTIPASIVYTPLIYPHPLQAFEGSPTVVTNISISVSPEPSAFGANFTTSWAVQTNGVTDTAAPGNVTLYVDQAVISSTALSSGAGSAPATATAGSHVVSVSFPGYSTSGVLTNFVTHVVSAAPPPAVSGYFAPFSH